MDTFNNGFKNCTSPHSNLTIKLTQKKRQGSCRKQLCIMRKDACVFVQLFKNRESEFNLTVSNFWVFEFIIYTIFSRNSFFLSIKSPILLDLEEYLAAKRICITGLQQIIHFSKACWSCMHLHKILETDKLIFAFNQRLGGS